jgi:hypothetical protein
MNFFDQKDVGNHLLKLCPKVVKHPVYKSCVSTGFAKQIMSILRILCYNGSLVT